MSDYLDRLQTELLAAGRGYQERGATSSAGAGRPRRRLTGLVPVVVSLAVTVLVVAAALGIGLIHGASPSATGQHGRGPVSPAPVNPTQPKVTVAPACRTGGAHPGLPPLVMSDAAPSAQLRSILALAREPAGGEGAAAIRGFDRSPLNVLTVFRRYIRIVAGGRGVRAAFVPVVFCQQIDSGSGFTPSRIRITPAQAIIMVPLDLAPKVTAVTVSTAALIRSGFALPGLDTPDHQWMQGVVVPDGVTRVVMHFTPPFLHSYSATVAIRDNVGLIVRRPDYTPTSVSWYAADGHLIRTFVDRQAIRLENCLKAHRKNCS
jgi:hypothetical protein